MSSTSLSKEHNFVLHAYFVACWSFNAASFQSDYSGGPRFTATDPVIGNCVMVVLCLALLLTNTKNKTASDMRNALIHRILCVMGAVMLLSVGWMHIQNRDVYKSHHAYHDSNWRYAAALNMFGGVTLLARALYGLQAKTVLCFLTGLALIAGSVGLFKVLGADKATECPDAPFFGVEHGGAHYASSAVNVQHKSQYITVSDGVELAVDVYLPIDYNEETSEALPTFLHLTRYHRAEKRSWLTKFIVLFGHPPNKEAYFPMRILHYLKTFVIPGDKGYAFVSVDVRGTGASFGSRPLDLIEREIQDFGEIAHWTRQQPFCNGRIGTGGISYDGITGALMAAQGGIEAAALLFAPGDVFEDIGFVGGIPTIGFIDWYGAFTTASENNVPVNDVDNELPPIFKLLSNWGFEGVCPVFGSEARLTTAVAEHKFNFDMLAKARDPTVVTKESTLVVTADGKQFSARDMGITEKTYQALAEHKVAVYSVAGYFDSGSVRSAARIHNYLVRNGASSKLTIGPWTHGCRACWTPTRGESATKSQYPLFEDVKIFFDCKLKDICGDQNEPTLNHFVLGEDKWYGSHGEWPPTGLNENTLPLSQFEVDKNQALIEVNGPNVSFQTDLAATTGIASRWNLVYHLMKKPVTYPDRAEQSRTSLVLHRQVGEHGVTIVGSPTITLALALVDGTDAAVFAYLEEIDTVSGKTNYITEAALRVSHRSKKGKARNGNRVGAFDGVLRSFLDADMKPLKRNTFTQIDIVMEPVAYHIGAHSTLRLVLAGADADNFFIENISDLATKWKVDIGKSKLALPISA